MDRADRRKRPTIHGCQVHYKKDKVAYLSGLSNSISDPRRDCVPRTLLECKTVGSDSGNLNRQTREEERTESQWRLRRCQAWESRDS
jgi:hypothetical protein